MVMERKRIVVNLARWQKMIDFSPFYLVFLLQGSSFIFSLVISDLPDMYTGSLGRLNAALHSPTCPQYTL